MWYTVLYNFDFPQFALDASNAISLGQFQQTLVVKNKEGIGQTADQMMDKVYCCGYSTYSNEAIAYD